MTRGGEIRETVAHPTWTATVMPDPRDANPAPALLLSPPCQREAAGAGKIGVPCPHRVVSPPCRTEIEITTRSRSLADGTLDSRSAFLLVVLDAGDHGLGRQHERGDRGGILQRGSGDLGRVDDSGLEHVHEVAGIRVEAHSA